MVKLKIGPKEFSKIFEKHIKENTVTCKTCLSTFVKVFDEDLCSYCQRVRDRSRREGELVMI